MVKKKREFLCVKWTTLDKVGESEEFSEKLYFYFCTNEMWIAKLNVTRKKKPNKESLKSRQLSREFVVPLWSWNWSEKRRALLKSHRAENGNVNEIKVRKSPTRRKSEEKNYRELNDLDRDDDDDGWTLNSTITRSSGSCLWIHHTHDWAPYVCENGKKTTTDWSIVEREQLKQLMKLKFL